MICQSNDNTSVFDCKFADDLKKAINLKEKGNLSDAVDVLQKGKKFSKRKIPALFYELCIISWKIKRSLALDEFFELDNARARLLEILNEVQGLPCSIEGSITELCAISNILFLDLIKRKSISSTASCFVNEIICSALIVSLQRVTSMAATSFHEQTEVLHQVHNLSSKHVLKKMTEASRMLRNMPELQLGHELTLLFAFLSLMMTIWLNAQGQFMTELVNENVKLSRKLKSQGPSAYVMMTGALLHDNHIHDLEYEACLLAGLVHLINGDKDLALKMADNISCHDQTSRFSKLLKALILLEAKDFDKCCIVTQSLCSALRDENHENDSLLLNIAWNIAGICYFELEKPNIAVRNFACSLQSSSENKAPLINLFIALETLGQHDTRIECLKNALQLTKSVCKETLSFFVGSFAFEEILLLKICSEYMTKYYGTIANASTEPLCLYSPKLNEKKLLRQLADCLYLQRRFKESSFVYLNLIEKLNHGCCTDDFDENEASLLLVYHEAADALLRAEMFDQGLTVLNYVLSFGKQIQTTIANGNGKVDKFDEDVITLMYKSEFLRLSGQENDAISLMKRIACVLEDDMGTDQPFPKKSRIAASSEHGHVYHCFLELAVVKVLLYNNLGVIFASRNETKEALVAFRNAIKTMKEASDDIVVFNYCKLLLEMKMESVALRNWNEVYEANETLGNLKRKLSGCYKTRNFSLIKERIKNL